VKILMRPHRATIMSRCYSSHQWIRERTRRTGSPAAPYPVAGRRVSDPLVECGIWIRFRPACRSGPVEACTPGEWSGNNPRPPTEF